MSAAQGYGLGVVRDHVLAHEHRDRVMVSGHCAGTKVGYRALSGVVTELVVELDDGRRVAVTPDQVRVLGPVLPANVIAFPRRGVR